jgi:hypothetical protein
MSDVSGILDGVEEVGVPAWTTHVFGQGGSFPGDTNCELEVGVHVAAVALVGDHEGVFVAVSSI